MSTGQSEVQTLSQLIASGINCFAKQADIIEAIIKNNKNELERYASDISSGQTLETIWVTARDSAKFQSQLYDAGIPFAKVMRDTTTGELLSPDGVDSSGGVSFKVKDIHLTLAEEYRNALVEAYEKIKEFEDKQTAEKMFEGIKTSYITNLTPLDAELLAREFEKNNVFFKRLYNKETETMELEVSESAFERSSTREMSKAEKSIHDTVLKGMDPNYKNSVLFEITNKKLIENVIENEKNKKNDHRYTIFDSSNPQLKLHFENGLVIATNKDNKNIVWDLSRKNHDKYIENFITTHFETPSVLKTSEYLKAVEEKDTELLSKNSSFVMSAAFNEFNLNEYCKLTSEEHLMDVTFTKNSDKEHQMTEIKIPDSDKLFHRVLDMLPTLKEQTDSIADIELVNDISTEINREISLKMADMKISNPSIHKQNKAYLFLDEHEDLLLKALNDAYEADEELLHEEIDNDKDNIPDVEDLFVDANHNDIDDRKEYLTPGENDSPEW